MTTKTYRIIASQLFEKEFAKIDPGVKKLIAKYIKNYLDGCADLKEKGKPLFGDKQGLWRYRIGDYRMICEIYDDKCIIMALNIGHRRFIYKKRTHYR